MQQEQMTYSENRYLHFKILTFIIFCYYLVRFLLIHLLLFICNSALLISLSQHISLV